MQRTFDERVRAGGDAAVREMGRFFMRDGPVYAALRKVTARLDALGIPYAVVGGMALVAHGYLRATTDVDLLVTPDGLRAVHEALEGPGYVPPFKGSKQLRDTENDVRIEFQVTGQYPGDGKPKPVAFPDPAGVGVDMGGIRYLALPTLVQLKLASGMTGNITRQKDITDVIELVRLLALPRAFGEQLDPYVRGKFHELWDAVAASEPPFES